MGLKRTDEFRADAVRIALTSGLTRKQVASDLGVGLSTLNKWLRPIETLRWCLTRTWTLLVRMNGFGERTVFSRRRGIF